MDPEAKELLEKTYELEKENNHMLRRLRRAQRYAALMRVAYWFIIIGLGVGAFYFIQPYIDAITGSIGETKSTFEQFKSFLPK
ncbi:MAG TPA: hypothetical protein VJB09_01550 [Candidatus Paceibacterota bacterium]